MLKRLALVSVAFLFVGVAASGPEGPPLTLSQENAGPAPAKPPKTIAEEGGEPCEKCPEACMTAITALEKRLNAKMDQLGQALTKTIEGIDSRLQALEHDTLPKLQMQVDDLDGYVKGTKIKGKLDDVEAGIENLNDQLADVYETLNAISTIDDSVPGQPQHTLAMRNNMKNSPNKFRDEVYKTTKFRLQICNNSQKPGKLDVNGVAWELRTDTKLSYVPVPPGPITVRKKNCDPLVIYDNQVRWEDDSKGFFLKYDYETNRIIQGKPANK